MVLGLGEVGKGATVREWLRWKLIGLMNCFDDTCLTELVMWATNPGIHPFWEILSMRHTAGQCERRGELPYCGKCAMRGGKHGRE